MKTDSHSILDRKKTETNTSQRSTYVPVKAEPHTPPYKIHKYFARRPWNVFNQLVNNFSSCGDVILDPFCGGGVTVYEGLKHNRKIIGCDLNPLSIFVVKNMVKKLVDPTALLNAFDLSEIYLSTLYKGFDSFNHENKSIKIEWSEVAFVVKCFHCKKDIVLSNDNRIKNGVYKCSNSKCLSNKKVGGGIEARFCERSGTKHLFNIGYSSQGKKIVRAFDKTDENKRKKHLEFLRNEVKKNNVKVPQDKIPLNWDRQFEDQLAKKGILNFQDLFTERNLLINLLLLNFIQSLRSSLAGSEYELLRIAFSNIVKDNNIMSFTNDTWQSGKPTTWSKHAYWIPSQFCEVNTEDVFRKSKHRIVSVINYNKGLDFIPREVQTYDDLNEEGNLLLWNKSVVDLDLPKNSVDAVITDPPYGSNVQYLELSHFWYPWNKDLYNVEPDFKSEAVSNRKKNFDGAKSMHDYEQNLYRVFKKAFDVLKPERYMVLTFNNKNINAWLALLFSIFRAGFTLEKEGIYFQDGVKNYKQTAHTKYEGSPYGDFIYVFKKSGDSLIKQRTYKDEKFFWDDLHAVFSDHFEKINTDRNDLIKKMFLEVMPIIESFSKNYLLRNKHNLYATLKKDYFDHLYD